VYKTPAVGGFQFPTFHYLIRENVIGDFGRGGPLVFGILRPAANCPNFRTGNVLVVPNVGNNWHPACWKMHRFHEYEFFYFFKDGDAAFCHITGHLFMSFSDILALVTVKACHFPKFDANSLTVFDYSC